MIYKFSCSAKCCVKIPQFNWLFMYIFDIAGSSFSCSLVFYLEVVSIPQFNWLFMYIFGITGSSFSCSLVFYLEVVSIALYTDDPVTSSPLQITFAGLPVFKEYCHQLQN